MSLLRVTVLALALATSLPSISHAGESPARTTFNATHPVHHRRI